jgi:hypothetical protein
MHLRTDLALSFLIAGQMVQTNRWDSRTLSKAETNYSHLDKEALAIIFGVKKYHQHLYGRHFEIQTDHTPLTHLFNENKTVPAMASGRIQRWALLLSAYDYTIRYKQGKTNANADALSRLPLPSDTREIPIPAEVIHLMEHLDATPLSSSHIRQWTDQDLTLSKLKRWVMEGWPDQPDSDQELAPYVQELGNEGGCLLCWCRVVVPLRGRKWALQMLHESHPGMARMKVLARSYMWRPGMDKEIKQHVKQCSDCQTTRKERPTTSSTPSLDLARETLELYSHRSCWANGGEDVLTHDGCTFEVDGSPQHKLGNINSDD